MPKYPPMGDRDEREALVELFSLIGRKSREGKSIVEEGLRECVSEVEEEAVGDELVRSCEGPGCDGVVPKPSRGRWGRFCSAACKKRWQRGRG